MRIESRTLIIISSLIIILVALSGFIVFRDYFIQGGRETVEKTVYVTMTKTAYSFLTETTTIKTALTERTTVTITSTATTVTTPWRTSEEVSCILFRSNKDVYERSEPVVVRLVNNCSFDVVLPNSAPWLIIDSSGRMVFSPIALQVITVLKSGEAKEWVWGQTDNEGKQVPAGTYIVKLMTVNCGILSTTIRIE
jgi:hypothetical protein